MALDRTENMYYCTAHYSLHTVTLASSTKLRPLRPKLRYHTFTLTTTRPMSASLKVAPRTRLRAVAPAVLKPAAARLRLVEDARVGL